MRRRILRNKYIIIIYLMLSSINVNAQELRGVVKDSITHKPLDYASVVVYGEQHRPITFQHTNQDGKFSITLPEGKKATTLLPV